MRPIARVTALACATAVFVACSSGGGDAKPPVGPGPATYRVTANADGALALTRGNAVLARLPADAFALGLVDAVEDRFNYSPYQLVLASSLYKPPKGFRWVEAESRTVTSATATKVDLALTFAEGRTATLTVEEQAPGRFALRLTPAPGDAPVAFVRVRLGTTATERFYGLGEYFDHVEHRGRLRAMHIESDSEVESDYNEAHVPVPLLVGTSGWGVFVKSMLPMVFDVAARQADAVDVIVGATFLQPDGLEFYLYGAERGIDITRKYYDTVGDPGIPPPWALGPWIWRDENRDQAQVEDDIAKIRSLDLATTGLWIDRPYATSVNSFDFDARKFSDPTAMIARIKGAGLRFALWHVPYLDRNSDRSRTLDDEAKARGYYPPKTGLALNQWGTLLDFTNPAALAWWTGLVRGYTAQGVNGFKLDYGEDVVLGILGVRNRWQFADGSDERTMHRRYTLLYHQAYVDALPGDGYFLLCRNGGWGDHRNQIIVWPGDLAADTSTHREVVTGDDGKPYGSVGGLPAAVVAGQSLGVSGYPFFASDTGGYRHAPPTKEVFIRWFQHTALTVAMQVGTSTNDVAWEPTPGNGFDAEVLDLYRAFARLHLRLLPYNWSYVQRIKTDGRAVIRPFGLVYPELGRHPDDEYLLGDHLLVAPVVKTGVRARPIVFPPGDWYDWFTGEKIAGAGVERDVAVPLNKLPLYLAAGGTVPLLRPTIDTLDAAVDPSVDTFAAEKGRLWLRFVPTRAKGAFTVYDGTTIEHVTAADGEITVKVKPGSDFAKGVVLEMFASGTAPTVVIVDGAAVPEKGDVLGTGATGRRWEPDTAGGTLFVDLEGAGERTVVIRR